MKRGEIFLGTVTEKHTILDLCTGRPRHALVVRRDDACVEDWFFVPTALWAKVTIEGLGGDCRVAYGVGRRVRRVTPPRTETDDE